MFQPKPIDEGSIEKVLERAMRYRLLNEPLEAECICLDVIEIDPENQRALYTLVLSLADQFDRRPAEKMKEALEFVGRITDAYERAYLHGILCERRAKAIWKRGAVGAGPAAYGWFRQAMERYEDAQRLAPEGEADPILRWNTCARILNRNANTLVPEEETREQMLE